MGTESETNASATTYGQTATSTMGYQINVPVANGVVTNAETINKGFDGLATAFEGAAATAVTGLPSALSDIVASIKRFGEDGSAVIKAMNDFSTGTISQAKACMTAYSNASIEQVIALQKAQSNIDGATGAGLFGGPVSVKDKTFKQQKQRKPIVNSASYDRQLGTGEKTTTRTVAETTTPEGKPFQRDTKTTTTVSTETRTRISNETTTTSHEHGSGTDGNTKTKTTTTYSGESHRKSDGNDNIQSSGVRVTSTGQGSQPPIQVGVMSLSTAP